MGVKLRNPPCCLINTAFKLCQVHLLEFPRYVITVLDEYKTRLVSKLNPKFAHSGFLSHDAPLHHDAARQGGG